MRHRHAGPDHDLAGRLNDLQPAAGLTEDVNDVQIANGRRAEGSAQQVFGSVRTVSLAMPSGASPSDRRRQFTLAWTLSELVQRCDDMARLAEEMGQNAGAGHYLIETPRLRPSHLRTLVALPTGHMSPSVESDGRVHLFMRCATV